MLKTLKRLVPAVLFAAVLAIPIGCSKSDSSGAATAPPASKPAKAAAVEPTEKTAQADSNRATLTASPVTDTPEGPSPSAMADTAKKKLNAAVASDEGAKAARTLSDLGNKALASKTDAAKVKSDETQPVGDGAPGVVLEPKRLDLGQIPTNDAKAGFVRLVNRGDTPRTVLECKTSCGCTTANCQKGKVLEPGEEMEVEIKLSGGARTTKLNKTVTFIVSDQPPLQLPVSADAVSFVTIEPEGLDPDKNPDGKLTVKSIDGQPFTIKSMYPPIIESFPEEPKAEHEIYLSWEKWEEQAPRSTKLLFHLDHPKCLKAYGSVSAAAVKRNTPTPTPPKAPVNTATPKVDLDRLLTNKQTDRVLELIANGEIEVGSVDGQGQTPLIKAARWGNPTVIQALLDASADIGQSDRIGRTPLMYAAQSKNVEAVRVLLDSGANINQRDSIGNTPLCWGAGFGDAASVKELLDAGAQVEVSGALTGFTPLIWAAGFGEPETVRMLIDAGANIEATDVMQGATPIMNAARTGGPDNVKVLLDAGADMEARDKDGKTTLLIAASNAGADAEMIHLLVEAGADLTAKTHNGEDALALAKKRTDLRAEGVVKALEEAMAAKK